MAFKLRMVPGLSENACRWKPAILLVGELHVTKENKTRIEEHITFFYIFNN